MLSPSGVQAKETTAPHVCKPTYREHLMQENIVEMQAAESAYLGSERCNGLKKVAVLRGCRTDAWFIRHKVTGEVRVNSSTCKLRWCPICSEAKASYIAQQVREWIAEQTYPKFMTLTLRHSDLPLGQQVQELYDHFRNLRKLKWFRDRCTGGVWFFQVKRSCNDGRWHPHLHCVITGKYIPKNKLSQIWKGVTDGSYIVDIQMIKKVTDVASYLARYCARPAKMSLLPHSLRGETVDAFHGRRLCGSWGTGRALSFKPVPSTDHGEWQNVGSWSYVVNLAEHDERAAKILFAYKTGKPLECFEPLTDYRVDVPPDYEHPPPGRERFDQRLLF